MNRKVLGIAVVLLAAAMLATPVFAAPATRIEGVTMTLAAALIPDPDATLACDHNIFHNEGTAAGTATLTMPDQSELHFGYSGTWSGTAQWTGFPNPDPEGTNVVRSAVVLTCTDEGITGTFEGMLHTKTVGLPPPPLAIGVTSYTETHMVLQGTGDFKGQTLKISYAGAPPANLAGTLIIPK